MTRFWDGSGISWIKQSAPRSRQITTLTPDHSIFRGRTLFLTPNQTTEGIIDKIQTEIHNSLKLNIVQLQSNTKLKY